MGDDDDPVECAVCPCVGVCVGDDDPQHLPTRATTPARPSAPDK